MASFNWGITKYSWSTVRYSVFMPLFHRKWRPLDCIWNRASRFKGIISDSDNKFLWHESKDINKKSLFPKFQLIPISRFQVMHDYGLTHSKTPENTKLCCQACNSHTFSWPYHPCTSKIALVASKIPYHVQNFDSNVQMYSWICTTIFTRTHTGI